LYVLKHCIINSPNVGELQAECIATTGTTDENMLPGRVQLLLSQSERLKTLTVKTFVPRKSLQISVFNTYAMHYGNTCI
jgi:hypothetical protein